MNQPKVKLTPEAQDMIDMFSELDEVQCNQLALMIQTRKSTEFAKTFESHMVNWIMKSA